MQTQPQPLTADLRRELVVTDVQMPFNAMIILMVKLAIASIPALLILAFLVALLWGLALGFVSGVASGVSRISATEPKRSAAGESCTKNAECSTGVFCIGSPPRCQARFSEGMACSSSTECVGTLSCESGRCASSLVIRR